MASPHSMCTLHVLVAKGTIDEYVLDTLKGKKGVFEKILGQSHTTGLLSNSLLVDLDSGMESEDSDFASLLKAHCKKLNMGKYIRGELFRPSSEDFL